MFREAELIHPPYDFQVQVRIGPVLGLEFNSLAKTGFTLATGIESQPVMAGPSHENTTVSQHFDGGMGDPCSRPKQKAAQVGSRKGDAAIGCEGSN